MEVRRVTESRTTILYMAGFGMFVILSYMLVVAPVKKARESTIRMKYAEQQGLEINREKETKTEYERLE